jgi:DNA-binding NarL/FixJ family response regulator
MKKILVCVMASVLAWETVRLLQKSRASLQFLSHEEREILNLIAEGCTDHEIATRLRFREESPDKYLRNILKRLNARDISSAIEHAIEKGLLSMTYA